MEFTGGKCWMREAEMTDKRDKIYRKGAQKCHKLFFLRLLNVCIYLETSEMYIKFVHKTYRKGNWCRDSQTIY